MLADFGPPVRGETGRARAKASLNCGSLRRATKSSRTQDAASGLRFFNGSISGCVYRFELDCRAARGLWVCLAHWALQVLESVAARWHLRQRAAKSFTQPFNRLQLQIRSRLILGPAAIV